MQAIITIISHTFNRVCSTIGHVLKQLCPKTWFKNQPNTKSVKLSNDNSQLRVSFLGYLERRLTPKCWSIKA
eukprot:4629462-Amphidinium_carterae.1